MSRRNPENKQESSASNGVSLEGQEAPRSGGKDQPKKDAKGRARNASVVTRGDAKLFASNEALMRDVASLPFADAIGTVSPFSVGFKTDKEQVVVPGLAAMRVYPSIGNTRNPQDPFNLASSNFFTVLSTTVSGGSNAGFEAPDTTQYLITVGQIQSFLVWCTRIYAYARTYNSKNRYLPITVIEANGVDYHSIVGHLNDFRSGLDILFSKLASFPVPAGLYFVDRMIYEYAQVYSEGESIKDQLYMLVPEGFYKYGYDADNAGALFFDPIRDEEHPDHLLTFDEILEYGEDFFENLMYNSSMLKIAAYILRAYGGGTITLTSLQPDLVALPVYDYDFLMQFHNATVCTPHKLHVPTIEHDKTKQWLVSQFKYELSGEVQRNRNAALLFTGDRMLSIDEVIPTPYDVLESTRLMVGAEYNATEDAVYLIPALEVPTRVDIYRIVNGSAVKYPMNYAYNYLANDANGVNAVLQLSQMYACFKYLPAVFLMRYADASDTDPEGALCMQIDNYHVVDQPTLKLIHDAALMNMLSIPLIEELHKTGTRK